MRVNLLPRIAIAVVLILLAFHFLLSSVSVRSKGSWTKPFSFSLPGSGSTTSQEKTEDGVQHGESSPAAWHSPTNAESPHTSAVEQAFADEPSPPSFVSEPDEFLTPSAEPTSTHASASHSVAQAEPSAPFEHVANVMHSAHEHAPAHDVHANHGDESKLPCAQLPGADEVVFIIKTGATEVEEKIPVHFNTTLRCFPNYLLFSDFGEDFEGHTIHDALGQIVDQVRLDNDDFDLWRRLHDKGRASLASDELSINDDTDPNGGGGNPDNGGWRLDKFKNIPMVNYTIHRFPDAKWFIYTDADTYIVWSNLLKWVQRMDSSKLTYLGSPAMIDDQVFGHGGSGYVISNALMKKTADVYNTNQGQWDEYAATHWAGDCVLATLLEEIGAPLTWAYPLTQGGDPVVMDFWETGYDRRLWCYPAVSYHHIKPSTVASLWHLEQGWLNNGSTGDLHHGDVYKSWFLPQLSHQRDGWDNLAEDEMTEFEIADSWGCRDHCQTNSNCMQWSFKDNVCKTLDTTKLGHESADVESGWMIERIEEKVKELDLCEEGEWIVPDHDRQRRMTRHELAQLAAQKYR